MVNIFYRNDGEAVPIKDCDASKIDNSIIEFIIDYTAQNINESIEINYVKPGNLSNEILLDNRVNHKFEQNNERLIQTLGKAFKEEGICYVTLLRNLSQLIYFTFHELFHFIDPFETDIEISREIGADLYKVDFDKQIIKNVRIMFNELFATSRAMEVLILFNKNTIPKGVLNYSIMENDLYISLKGVINDFNRSLKKIDELNIFNDFRVYLIEYFFKNFIQFIIYYLGAWYKLKECDLEFDEFRECWNQFIDYVNDNIDSNLANFLINLKEQILKEWKYSDKIMIRYFEFEFIKYFVENDKNRNLYDYWMNL